MSPRGKVVRFPAKLPPAGQAPRVDLDTFRPLTDAELFKKGLLLEARIRGKKRAVERLLAQLEQDEEEAVCLECVMLERGLIEPKGG